MKNDLRMSQLTRGLLSLAIVSTGVVVYQSEAVAAISAGRHNLSSTDAARNRTSSTNEICVFCHTPHGADVSVAGAPLWNKAFTTGTFTPYGNPTGTVDGLYATDGGGTGGFLSGASLACLSCHDGTQAIDNLLNAPGSGGLSAGGGASGLAYAWSAGTGSGINTATGHLQGAAVLGQALNNDHPIGIQYCGGGPRVVSPGAACVDVDFRAPSTAVVGSSTVFWVDTGVGAGNRNKTDMILYNRGFTTVGVAPSVECASCHDVHSSNALFLRISNANSAVCLACHVK